MRHSSTVIVHAGPSQASPFSMALAFLQFEMVAVSEKGFYSIDYGPLPLVTRLVQRRDD